MTEAKKEPRQEEADSYYYEEGYRKALELLHQCRSEHGFLASPTPKANYRRIWGRDGVIVGLASLLTGDEKLRDGFKRTLETLAYYQGPHGEIPSNVDPLSERISYGGMTGRIDADLWFIIGCGEYWRETGDEDFLERMLPAVDKVVFLLGAWEFNNRGLLYIPQTGDWADEYVHSGYVLYDQLLYLQALRTVCAMRLHVDCSSDHMLQEKASRLHHLIRANYWLEESEPIPEDVYHRILYEKGLMAVSYCGGSYWMPFFTPHGYGYRFDSFANILASLLRISDRRQAELVDEYMHRELLKQKEAVVPAFHPVITPFHRAWEELNITFSYTFKNKPYEYHNGGRWPMLSGFRVADLAAHGRKEKARRHLLCLHKANALEMDGEKWSFPEYVHGKNGGPGGTKYQAWSAAGAVIGHHTVEGKKIFRIGTHG